MDDDDPGAGYALFGDKGELSTSPHGDLRAYTFAGRTLQLHQCVPGTAHPIRHAATPEATGWTALSPPPPHRPHGWLAPGRMNGWPPAASG